MGRVPASLRAGLAILVFAACVAIPALAAEDPWEDYRPIELTCPGQAEPGLVLTSQSIRDIGVRDRVTLDFAGGEIVSVTLEGAAAGHDFEEIFAGSPDDADAKAAGNAKRVIAILEPYRTACSEGGQALVQVEQALKENRQLLGLD